MMIQKDFRHNQENLAPFLRFCVGICFLFSALWKVFHMNEGFRYVIFIFFSQDYRQFFETFAGKMLCFWTEWCGLFMLSIEFMLLCRNPLLRLKCHSLGIINVKWQMDTISKDATGNFRLRQFWSWSQNSRFAEFRHRAILFIN